MVSDHKRNPKEALEAGEQGKESASDRTFWNCRESKTKMVMLVLMLLLLLPVLCFPVPSCLPACLHSYTSFCLLWR